DRTLRPGTAVRKHSPGRPLPRRPIRGGGGGPLDAALAARLLLPGDGPLASGPARRGAQGTGRGKETDRRKQPTGDILGDAAGDRSPAPRGGRAGEAGRR